MKDFLGRDLAVGDFVIFMEKGYRNLKLAQIERLTPTTVMISWGQKDWEKLRQTPTQLVKVEGPDLTFFLLNQK